VAWYEITIKNFQEYIQLVNDLGINVGSMYNWNFRGQADSSWKLEHSLLRILQGINDRAWAGNLEGEILTEFYIKKDLYLPGHQPHQDADRASWWAIMQHYSCPTRLLDWSASPYVAAYFAVNNLSEQDGAIWIFNANELNRIMMEKYRDLSVIPDNEQYYDLDGPDIIRTIRTLDNPRIAAQQGVFTVCTNILEDHSNMIEAGFGKDSYQHLIKIIIPSEMKKNILSQLHTMNITAASLFPGIDGLGLKVSEVIKLKVYHREFPI